MSTTPVRVPRQDEAHEAPFPPVVVEEVLRQFDKTIRARQLYRANNPAYTQALDRLRSSFAPLWAQAESVTLQVTDTQFRWCNVVVHDQPTKASDSLPWLFFKDGLRELTIMRGFETAEVEQLIDIVPRVRRAQPDEDDLVTLLWEHEFAHLSYRHVEIGHDGVASIANSPPSGRLPADSPAAAGVVAEPREAAETARAEVAGGASPAPGVVNLDSFDSTLYFLDQKEIDYIKREIELEYQTDLRRTVLDSLLDIFELQADPAVRGEVLRLLEQLVLHMLAGGQLQTVAYLLQEIPNVIGRAVELVSQQRDQLRGLTSRLSDPATLSQILQQLDHATALPSEKDLTALFGGLQASALETLLAWLSQVHTPALRTLLEASAGRLAETQTGELVRLISSPDSRVALEAIRRAGALKASAAVSPLSKLLAEADRELRIAAVNALVEIGSAGAMQMLERSLSDGDREVRMAAVRAIGSRGQRSALARIDAIVKSRELRNTDLTERMAFFEAYGELCGDGGVPYLDGLLNGKSGLLGRREDPEVRACAAMALGHIRSARAEDSLRKGLAEKDVLVRNAVNRALRRGAP